MRLSLAREYAIAKDWEAARGELNHVESSPIPDRPAAILVRKAVLEIKAKRREAAEQWIQQALSLEPPAVVWLELAVEAARYRLPDTTRLNFNRQSLASMVRTPPTFASFKVKMMTRD